MPALANATRKADPAAASALAPWDGRLTAAHSRVMFTSLSRADSISAGRQATQALLQDATAVDALVVLAFQAQLRGEAARSDQYFGLVSAFSRRETGANIWAIEQAVNRGDIAGALYRYDLALRASNDVSQILFPILASALAEPAVRSALVNRLVGRPSWKDRFLEFAATKSNNPLATRDFFLAANRSGVPIADVHWAAVVDGLLRVGMPEEAWKYYRSRFPNARRSESRDPNFAEPSRARTRFDWLPAETSEVSAAIIRQGNSGVLEFALASPGGGVVATQEQLLAPGVYRLDAQTSGFAQPSLSQPFFKLRCAGGRDLGRIVLSQSSQDRARTTGSFTVPQGCPAQVLTFEAALVDNPAGSTGYLYSVLLRKVEG